MFVLVRLLVVLSISHGAFAKNENLSCAQYLADQPTQVDYALSDLEGSFFELVKKVAAADEVPASRVDKYVKDILSMKAAVLNSIVGILPAVHQPQHLAAIFQIIDSLGVDPQMYGLTLNKDSRVESTMAERARRTDYREPAFEESKGAPIGFVQFNKSLSKDLPLGIQRSIGFGPQEIKIDPAPKRKTGFITRQFDANSPNMKIIDLETKTAYQVNLVVMTSLGAKFSDNAYQVRWNDDVKSWVVIVENLNNPSGKIGFL